MEKKYNSEETINEILNVSAELFIEKGYEKTTIQDIVDGLDGLSRGAIYHHFKSKDEIVNAVVNRLFPENHHFNIVNERKDLTGLEKLRTILIDITDITKNKASIQFYGMFPSLFDNPKFFAYHMYTNANEIAPQIKKLLDEANHDGSLNIKYTKQMSEVILLLLSTWFIPAIFPATIEEFHEKLATTKYLLDGIGLDILNEETLSVLSSLMNETN